MPRKTAKKTAKSNKVKKPSPLPKYRKPRKINLWISLPIAFAIILIIFTVLKPMNTQNSNTLSNVTETTQNDNVDTIVEGEEYQHDIESGIFNECAYNYYLYRTQVSYEEILLINITTLNPTDDIETMISELSSCSKDILESKGIMNFPVLIQITKQTDSEVEFKEWKNY